MEDVDKFKEINIKFIMPAADVDNYGEIMTDNNIYDEAEDVDKFDGKFIMTADD